MILAQQVRLLLLHESQLLLLLCQLDVDLLLRMSAAPS